MTRQKSVEDDAVTTRSNSDDEHQVSGTDKKNTKGQQGRILDSYTKIWESFSDTKQDRSTVADASGTSLKGSPILGF